MDSAPTQPGIVIRPSTDADVAAMIEIYEHHIRHGVGDTGDFEEDRLRPDDLKRRRKNMRSKRLPHLVAERHGMVAGYAYAVPFRKRPAYRYTLKHSIYVHAGISMPHRTAPAAGADRGLRGGRLPPDDRLHRRRERGQFAPARGLRLHACRTPAGRWPTATAAGPTA